MENNAEFWTALSVGINFFMVTATFALAVQASRQLAFMKAESELAKYPNVLLFPEGLFVKAKPPVEHHEGLEPIGFVFFNMNPMRVVYLGGHFFKWDQDRWLSSKTLSELDFGSREQGWIGYLYPRLPGVDSGLGYDQGERKRTIVVEPSSTLTLAVDDWHELLEFLDEGGEGRPVYALVVLDLAYPTVPGGIVRVGVPFRLEEGSIESGGDSHEVNIVGEMISEQLVYFSPIKDKKVKT